MKLAFSNIAWTPHDRPDVLKLLRGHGFTGIEVAPTKVWPEWQGATVAAAKQYRASLEAEGFVVPALQAVLFARPEARLFDHDGERALTEHLTHVADLAGALGAKAVVLGAPRQRTRGELSIGEAMSRAADVLRPLAKIYAERGTCLCIEPNPRRYACDFVINAAEGVELVRRIDHPGFGLHLDAAGMFLEEDDLAEVWNEAAPLVRHFHISEPELGDFREPRVPHARNLEFLRTMRYSGWCSVEMREPTVHLELAGPWASLRVEGSSRAA